MPYGKSTITKIKAFGSKAGVKAKKASKAARMWPMAVMSAATFGVVAELAPQNLPVVVWKLAIICLGAFLAYWIDRALFPYARPHSLVHPQLQTAFNFSTIRRAIIVAATMLSLALAV